MGNLELEKIAFIFHSLSHAGVLSWVGFQGANFGAEFSAQRFRRKCPYDQDLWKGRRESRTGQESNCNADLVRSLTNSMGSSRA